MKPAYLVIATIAAACGWYGAILLRHPAGVPATHEGGEGRMMLLYQCPMHPWVKAQLGDRCTVCGMNLVSSSMCGPMLTDTATQIVILSPGSVSAAGVQTIAVKKKGSSGF